MATEADRRVHARYRVTRPCTFFRRLTCKYLAGQTWDLSQGGVLLEVETPRGMIVGEMVELGVAWTGSALLSRGSLLEAKVVRVTPMEGSKHRVALSFLDKERLALPATPLPAVA